MRNTCEKCDILRQNARLASVEEPRSKQRNLEEPWAAPLAGGRVHVEE
jgi:hypothetical protein